MITIKGKNLTKKQIKKIDQIYKENFQGQDSFKNNLYKKDLFFIHKSRFGKILAIGRLIPTKVKSGTKEYHIQGIADIISTKKGRGYGKRIIKNIKQYLEKKQELGVGFCEVSNKGFYESADFRIISNKIKNLRYKKKKVLVEDTEIIWVGIDNGLIPKIKKGVVNIAIPPW